MEEGEDGFDFDTSFFTMMMITMMIRSRVLVVLISLGMIIPFTISRELMLRQQQQFSKAGSKQKPWTYNPTSEISGIVALSQPNPPPGKGGKAPSKGGKDTRQHKATSACCQICPYKFHNTLALLEISEERRDAAASRFKEWHESYESNKADVRDMTMEFTSSRSRKSGAKCQRPQPKFNKIGKGSPGYPGVWTCPSVGGPDKNNPTICCDFCPSENYPDMDYELSSGTKPTPTKQDMKVNPNDPDAGCPVASKCGSSVKPGTNCDPTRPKCPMPPKPFPGTSAPCCNLCPEAFVPFQNDPIPKAGETPEIKTKSFKADENGFVMPDLKLLEIQTRTFKTFLAETNKKARSLESKDEAKNVRRCCYPCSAAEYNKSPGDAVFGEPQGEDERLRDLFRPLNIPYKNFVNRRKYAAGNTAKTGGK